MILASEGAFTWWGALGERAGLEFFAQMPPHIIGAWLVAIFLGMGSIIVGARYRNVEKAILPPTRLSLAGLTEVFAGGFVYGLAESTIGKHYKKFVWLLGPLFFYILVGNLFGLVPGFLPPTNNINTNLAMAAVVFVAYHGAGILANGFHYAKHFWAPAGLPIYMSIPIGILLLVLETFSHFSRPLSLSLRLYGNISGDHTILETFMHMLPLVVPVVFLTFGLLVAVIQAFVFTMLAAVYVAFATAHDH